MLREELRLFLDLIGEGVDLGRRRMRSALGAVNMAAQSAMKLVVALGVVVQHDAAGRLIDGDAFNSGNLAEHVRDLPQQVGIAFGGRNLHSHPAGDLMRNLELQIFHASGGRGRRRGFDGGRRRRGGLAFGVDFGDDVVDVLLRLGDHLLRLLTEDVGAAHGGAHAAGR